MNYRVTWDIEVEANSPEDAAEIAWDIQRSEDSFPVFDVASDDNIFIRRIDLSIQPQMIECTPETFPACGCGGFHSAREVAR